MPIVLTADPKKKLLRILAFFVGLCILMEIMGLRSQLSPETIRALFAEHTLVGLVLFCLAYSLGNLLYVPGWVFLVGAVYALGKEWGGHVYRWVVLLHIKLLYHSSGWWDGAPQLEPSLGR